MALRDRIRQYRELLRNSVGYFAYSRMPVKEGLVYIESRDGNDIADNIISILEELQKPGYRISRVVIYVRKEILRAKQELIRNCGFRNVHLTSSRTYGHFISERARYIIFDSTLYGKYAKREGQTVINTWHGTPYKVMGRRIESERHTVGTVQQRYLFSDYLLFANRYMMDTMIRDYMLENICQAKCLCEGFPRNARLLDPGHREAVRKALNLSDKQVTVYMPTFRGTMRNKKNQEQADRISAYLSAIDRMLGDGQVFYVKLHPYNDAAIDYSSYRHITRFPENIPGYDILSASDILVTDYSSVFFDYANTDRPIILFTYDEEEYFQDRGVYFPLEDLPFEKVRTAEALVDAINRRDKVDYSAFREGFGYYDRKDATERICQHIFNNAECCVEHAVPYNGKENVLIYGGSFAKNGITSSVINLANNLDDSRNWYLSYLQPEMVRSPSNINAIPDHIRYIPITQGAVDTIGEYKALKRYNRADVGLNALEMDNGLPEILRKKYDREWRRNLGYARIDRVINFDGYNSYAALVLSASGKADAIWMHNDLIQEKVVRNSCNLRALSYCFTRYQKVALVSEHLTKVARRLSIPDEKTMVVHNYFDQASIIAKSRLPLQLDKGTEITCSDPDGINHILASDAFKVITIGRFSPEKGHERLINAFDRFTADYPDSYLIIIGGHGPLHGKTKKTASEKASWKNIVIIRSLSNPMPILKKCDLFVLSSFHEGLPVVFFEALGLGIPVMSTDIPASREFVKQHGGMLVEDDEEGLYKGLMDIRKSGIKKQGKGFRDYNFKAVKEFYGIFNN